MEKLSIEQKQKLLSGDPYSRNGNLIPNTDKDVGINKLNSAACWSWALNGEYVNFDNPFSVPDIYENLFTYTFINANKKPISVNIEYVKSLNELFPQAAGYTSSIINNFHNAINGDNAAQNECQRALCKITAIAHGYTVSDYNTSNSEYALHLKSESWYGWGHWGISIQMTDGTRNYVQTVSGSPNNPMGIMYKCNTMWDEHLSGIDISIDGLQKAHVDVINLII